MARSGEASPRSESPPSRGIGQKLSNFTLKDAVNGREVALYGFAGKKAAVLVFLGADCPLANLYAPRLAELQESYAKRGVVFLGIDSNAHDSEQAIKELAKQQGLGFPVLKDKGNVLADLALVERTPEVVVLDGLARMRYRGAIDDQYGQGTRKDKPDHEYLKDALEAILAGRNIAVTATATPGCLIDRVEPKERGPAPARVRPAPAELLASRSDEEAAAAAAIGQVDYASSAAAIMQRKCQSCHRPGQVAPFSLLTYDDARKHAAMIHEVVDNRRMPPWHADPRYGKFANDHSLTAKERATLIAWVEQGTPLGDPKKIPTAHTFPEGWTIGKPDLVIEIPETYVVPAHGVVDYVRFRVPTGFKEDRWVQAAEAVPGDRSVVHHIIVYVLDGTGKRMRPGQPPHLCGYAPGDMPSVYPDGTAKKVPAGAEFLFEIHYTPIGRIRTDRSKVGLIFSKVPVTRQAYTVAIADDKFMIPPRTDNVAVASSLTLAQDTRLLSFMPHMHLRGKDFRYTITRPGQAQEVILSVPAYDFGWQSYYVLAKPLVLPKGTRIDCLAHYDNTDKNPYNPDPGKTVRWGDQTFEEMMIGYVDIDLPAGTPFERSQGDRAGVPRRARDRAVAQIIGSFLSTRPKAGSATENAPR
jgi:peroxiredoxin/mono/diheme cytochrome c family protein